MDLTNIYRTFHPKKPDTFFSSESTTFSRIDHTVGHKTNLKKLRLKSFPTIPVWNKKSITRKKTGIIQTHGG